MRLVELPSGELFNPSTVVLVSPCANFVRVSFVSGEETRIDTGGLAESKLKVDELRMKIEQAMAE